MSTSLTFTISGPESAQLKERIRQEATEKGVSISEWITEAIVEYLRKKS
jgi:predicted HicB family RNase H-like nuclease